MAAAAGLAIGHSADAGGSTPLAIICDKGTVGATSAVTNLYEALLGKQGSSRSGGHGGSGGLLGARSGGGGSGGRSRSGLPHSVGRSGGPPSALRCARSEGAVLLPSLTASYSAGNKRKFTIRQRPSPSPAPGPGRTAASPDARSPAIVSAAAFGLAITSPQEDNQQQQVPDDGFDGQRREGLPVACEVAAGGRSVEGGGEEGRWSGALPAPRRLQGTPPGGDLAGREE